MRSVGASSVLGFLATLAVACGPPSSAPTGVSMAASSGGEVPVELASSAELIQTVTLCRTVADLDAIYARSSSGESSSGAWPRRESDVTPSGWSEFLRFCREGTALASFVQDPSGRTERFRGWERFAAQAERYHSAIQGGETTCPEGDPSASPPFVRILVRGRAGGSEQQHCVSPTQVGLGPEDFASLSIGPADASQRSAIFGGLSATALLSGIASFAEERAHQEMQLYVARNIYELLSCDQVPAGTDQDGTEGGVDDVGAGFCPARLEDVRPGHFLRSACQTLDAWRGDIGETGGSMSWSVLAEALQSDLEALPVNLSCLAVGEDATTTRGRILGWARFLLYVVGAVQETLDPVQIADVLERRVEDDQLLPREARIAALLFGVVARLPRVADLPAEPIMGVFRTLAMDRTYPVLLERTRRRLALEDAMGAAAEASSGRLTAIEGLRGHLARLGMCTGREADRRVRLRELAQNRLEAPPEWPTPADTSCRDAVPDDGSNAEAWRTALGSLELDGPLLGWLVGVDELLTILTSGRAREPDSWHALYDQLQPMLYLLGRATPTGGQGRQLTLFEALRPGRTGSVDPEDIRRAALEVLPELLSDAYCGGDAGCEARLAERMAAVRQVLAAIGEARAAAQALSAGGEITDEERAALISTLANTALRALVGSVRVVSGHELELEIPDSLAPLVQAIVVGDGPAILPRTLRLLSDVSEQVRQLPRFEVSRPRVVAVRGEQEWAAAVLADDDALRNCLEGFDFYRNRFAIRRTEAGVRVTGGTGRSSTCVRSAIEARLNGDVAEAPSTTDLPFGTVESIDLDLDYDGRREDMLRVTTDIDADSVTLPERWRELPAATHGAMRSCFVAQGLEYASVLAIGDAAASVTRARGVDADVSSQQDALDGCIRDATNPDSGATAIPQGLGVVFELRRRRGAGLDTRVLDGVTRALAFGTELAEAETAEDVEQVLESFAAPVGSYARKRHQIGVSVTALLAAQTGFELYPTRSRRSLPSVGGLLGFQLSLGLDFTLPLQSWGSLGLYFPVLNLSPFASFAAGDDLEAEPAFEGASFVSPGLFVRWGIGDTPFVVGGGVSYTPDLRRYDFVGTTGAPQSEFLGAVQVGLFVGVDATIWGWGF